MEVSIILLVLLGAFLVSECFIFPQFSAEKSYIMSLTMCDSQLAEIKGHYVMRESTNNNDPRKLPVFCRFSRFRTADGTCNNLNNPTWGASSERFKRFLKPAYADWIGAPRIFSKSRCTRGTAGCVKGKSLLPSPRAVSVTVHTPSQTTSIFTVMMMSWGQFIDHDCTAAAILQPSSASCCNNYQAKRGKLHPDSFKQSGTCFTIPIDQRRYDRFFTTKCMEFVRSRSISNNVSKYKPREQQNLLTAFIDASMVYGSDKETQLSLRDTKGRMKVSPGNLLPKGRYEDCVTTNAPYCFAAGDDRVHVFPGLTVLHTAFVRLHNTIVNELNTLTNWDDERLFQETRQIIGALLQKITYSEFLPELLNKDYRTAYDLAEDAPYYYNNSIDPSVANVFATAAFRYGHSQIPNHLVIDGKRVLSRFLFNNPQYIFTSLKSVVENLLTNPAEVIDRHFSREITDRLMFGGTMSFDLIAFNIQRGRDHGLPPYNAFREFCGLPKITSFYSKDLGSAGVFLKKVYSHVDDIDIYTGGVIEPRLPGSILGPTFSCIIARQFRDLKYGDRMWYQTANKYKNILFHTTKNYKGFTSDQLKSIEELTISKILCEEFGLEEIQRNPFRTVSPGNPKVKCCDIDSLNLQPWRL